MRIRRIWQFPNPGTSYEDNVPADPVLQDSFQVIYTNPNPINADGWFMGDVVPFTRCSYVVNLASQLSGSTLTKYYTFE